MLASPPLCLAPSTKHFGALIQVYTVIKCNKTKWLLCCNLSESQVPLAAQDHHIHIVLSHEVEV